MKYFICLVIGVSISRPGFSQKITVSGYVKDGATGESLIGASIINAQEQTGATSNQYGFFSLLCNSVDSIDLIISYQGYQLLAKRIAGQKNIQLTLDLKSITPTLETVTVRSNGNNNVKNPQMGIIDVPISAIKTLPALIGERDIFKVIQLLPGVQGGQEGTSGFYVRGGNLDQNLVLLDDATVYNPNHLFGLFSTFNVNAINHVRLIKGGFPAEYGGRLSSILNITMKEGNKYVYQTEGGISLLATNITFQGPVQKAKSSFVVSLRKSFVNLLLKPATSKTTSYDFYDLNAKINFEVGKNDHIYFSFFRGNDNAAYVGANSLNYKTKFGNNTGTFRWNHVFNNKVFENTSLIYDNYHLGLGSTQNNYYEVLYSEIKDLTVKTDFNFRPVPHHSIKAGFNYTFHTLFPTAVSSKVPSRGNRISIDKKSIPKRQSSEAAFYIADDYDFSKSFSVNYGLRFPLFYGGGAGYAGVEPRITGKYLLDESTSIKASWTLMKQFLHAVPNSTASLPTDTWISSSRQVKPQTSSQIALGLYKNLRNNSIETSAEIYYKTMNNEVLFKEGAEVKLNTNIDSILTFGNGKSYGVELFMRKITGNLTGWISYTLSKTTQVFPDLNRGAVFPASFDRRHNLSVVASYKLNNRWTFSSYFVFYTGRAFTLPSGRVTVPVNGSLYNGVYYDYTSRNNARLRSYHRLDISFSNKKTVKLWHKKVEREWVFSAYNAYNHLNPYFVYLTTNPDTKQPEAIQVSLLPVVPSVSFNIKF